MGHEILYCVGCQTQLRGSDFERRHAFRVDGKGYCSRCAQNTFPAERLAAIKESISPPSTKPRETPAKPTRRVAAAEATSSKLLWLGSAGALAVVAILIALLSGGGPPPRPEPPVSPPARPVVVQKVVVAPAPLPDPAGLDAELKRLLPQREFGQALRLIESARALSAQPEWTRIVNQRSDDVHARAETALKELKAKAVEAKRAGNLDEPLKIREQLEKWEYGRALPDFDAALSVVQPEKGGRIIFSQNFSSGPGTFQKGEVVDGALAIPPTGVTLDSPFPSPVGPTSAIRFRMKAPPAVKQLEFVMWSNSLRMNGWVHVAYLKPGEWQQVEFKASEFRVNWNRDGPSLEGHTGNGLTIHFDVADPNVRAQIDDFEIRE